MKMWNLRETNLELKQERKAEKTINKNHKIRRVGVKVSPTLWVKSVLRLAQKYASTNQEERKNCKNKQVKNLEMEEKI